MTQATIGRWGKTLAVRLPAKVVRAVGIREGDRVDLVPTDDGVTIRRANPPMSIEEMFRGRSPAEWRALYADSFDWGPDEGREVVPE